MALKSNIFKALFLMALYCLPTLSYAADIEEEVKALSAANFWAKVNNINIQDDEKEYIICGQSICDTSEKKCIVKVTQRNNLATQASKAAQIVGTSTVVAGGGAAATGIGAIPGAVLMAAGAKVFAVGAAIEVLAGTGTVTRYEYQCWDNNTNIPNGYKEAPDGGFVQKVKHRTGGWLAKARTKEESCYKANDGNKYCLLTKEKEGKDQKATVVYNNKGTAFNGCEVLPVKLYNNRRCFFCSLFTISVKVANDMTAKSFETFASAFAALIAMGLALWIAIQVLLQVSSITKQDAPKFLSNLIKQGYKFLIAFLLLHNSSYIFEKVVSPFISTGIKFSTTMIGEDTFEVINSNVNAKDNITEIEKENPGILNRSSSINTANGKNQYISSEVYIQLDNLVARLQRKLSFMQSIGSSLICIGSNAMKIFHKDGLSWGDGFQLFIEGFLLAAFGFLMALAFAFYMVDGIVQLGVVGALMPFFIASWPFKLTSKYTKTGWDIFLNSIFMLMFSGLIISISYNLVDSATNFTSGKTETATTYDEEELKKDKDQTSSVTEMDKGALYQLAQIINRQNEGDLAEATDISSIGFLMLLFCCIFALNLVGKIQELAGQFSKGALSPVAPGIATMGASAAKSLALKSTKTFRKATGDRIEDGIKGVVSFGVGAIIHPQQTARRVVSGLKSFHKEAKELGRDIKYKAKDVGNSIKSKRNKKSGN